LLTGKSFLKIHAIMKTLQNKFLSRENLHEVNSSGIKVYLCIIFLDNRMEFSN
jgi:hypothetical protein